MVSPLMFRVLSLLVSDPLACRFTDVSISGRLGVVGERSVSSALWRLRSFGFVQSSFMPSGSGVVRVLVLTPEAFELVSGVSLLAGELLAALSDCSVSARGSNKDFAVFLSGVVSGREVSESFVKLALCDPCFRVSRVSGNRLVEPV